MPPADGRSRPPSAPRHRHRSFPHRRIFPDSLICQRYSATSAAAATWSGWRSISHEGGRWIWALTTDRNVTAERPRRSSRGTRAVAADCCFRLEAVAAPTPTRRLQGRRGRNLSWSALPPACRAEQESRNVRELSFSEQVQYLLASLPRCPRWCSALVQAASSRSSCGHPGHPSQRQPWRRLWRSSRSRASVRRHHVRRRWLDPRADARPRRPACQLPSATARASDVCGASPS
jgi:hypothetical protein